jgi:hypothetical protein
VALLLGHRSIWSERVSPKLLDLILQSISAGTRESGSDQAPEED